jgi:small subunit ribosomal protein S1
VRAVRRVDVDQDRAELRRPVLDEDPLGAVGRPDADPVALLDAEVQQADRQRQRISLGLKQTQEDPWQRVVDTYNIGDELEGTVTKVVTFGAFVEILDGVEGLVHISELAQHHVENPREIIQPGDPVRVKILEIDSERRRLSLSIKRVEGQVLPVRPIVAPAADEIEDVPELGLSEEVFADNLSAPAEAYEETTPEAEAEVAEVESPDAADSEVEAPEAELEEAEAEEAETPEAEEAPAPGAEAETTEADEAATPSDDAEPEAQSSDEAEPKA